MKGLQQLINQLCPNGVEWKTLGKLCEINKGEQLNKENMSEVGSYPVINGGICPSGYVEVYNQPKDTITISQGGASAGYVNWMKTEFWAGAHCYVVIPNKEIVSNRYVYHYVKSIESKLQECQYGAGIPALAKKTVEQVQIPLPPLAIQSRIVEILDHFTNLTANLTAELALRRKQFEHFREKLLSLDGVPSAEKKTLGDVGEFIRGNGLQKSDFVNEGVGCIHYGQIHTIYNISTDKTVSFVTPEFSKKLRKAKYGDLIIATTSEDVDACCKAIAWLGNEEVAISGDSYIYRHNQNPLYVTYLFQTEKFQRQKRVAATGTKVVRVSGDSMAKFSFAFPPLAVQQSIVAKLDKFTALIQNIENELALRQKQYEYYREKLLSFPSPSL